MPDEDLSGGEYSNHGDWKDSAARGRRRAHRRGRRGFLIAGAGGIGAYVGARMAHAGFDVTLFARGPHLRAMQERGVQVKSPEGDFVARPAITAPSKMWGRWMLFFSE